MNINKIANSIIEFIVFIHNATFYNISLLGFEFIIADVILKYMSNCIIILYFPFHRYAKIQIHLRLVTLFCNENCFIC